MPGNGRRKPTEATRYLQLFDCGHILRVEEMDSWIMQGPKAEVQLIQCPRCSMAITFSFRYGNVIKRTLKNKENALKEMYDLANETSKSANQLMGSHTITLVQRMKFPRDILFVLKRFSSKAHLNILDRIGTSSIPFIFTIKNHLVIMGQAAEAQLTLKRMAVHQARTRQHLEIMQDSSTINQALENILEYLMKPQLDLRTLDQVWEHTRKFVLFALILEVQYEANNRELSLSSMAKTRLEMARQEFYLFLQGNNDAFDVNRLEKIATLLRKEVGLASIPPEEPKDFENFPGFSSGVWKLCEHHQVYFTRSIVRDGKDVTVVKRSCRKCVD